MFSVCNLLLTHSSVWRMAGLKHFKWKCQAFVSWRGQTSSTCYCKGNERADFSGMLVLWFQSELWVVIQHIWKILSPSKEHKLLSDPTADVSLLSFLALNQAKVILSPLPAGASRASSLQNVLVTNRESDTRLVPWQLLPHWSALCRRKWKRGENHMQDSVSLSSAALSHITALVSQELLPKLLASWQILFSNVR